MLDTFQSDQANLLDQASASPIPTQGTSAGEAFGAAFDANLRGTGTLSQNLNTMQFVQDQLDRYKAATGETLPNPLAIEPSTLADVVDPNTPTLQSTRDRFAARGMTFPSDGEIHAGAVALARANLSRQEQLSQGAQGFGAGVAGFAGNIAAGSLDPINALAVATIPEGGLAAKMLGAAASFGGSTLAGDLATYGYKKEVDPNFCPGQVIEDTAEAAAGGAAFELGGAAIGSVAGALWRRIKGTAPGLADAMPTAVADAGNAAERVADLGANNPFGTGPAAEAAHNAAVVSVERDMMAGNAPTLPPDASDILAAPTTAQLDRHAATLAPDLFTRVNDLDAQIAEARTALASRPSLADTLAQSQADVAGRLSDLQDRIAGFTDAERKSPAGIAALDDAQRLQQAPEPIHAAAQQAAFEAEQAQRLRLNDLQQQRAALGPTVNAARQAASADLASATGNVVLPRNDIPAPTELAHAYGDTATIEAAAAHPYQGVQRIAQALKDAAPQWNAMRDAASRGLVPPTSDITSDLMGAVRAIVQARSQGRTLADLMFTGDLFHSDMAQTATKLFFREDRPGQFLSRSQIAGNLRDLADGIRGAATDNLSFADAAPDVLRDPTVATGIREATTPKAIETAPTSPAVHQAAEAGLQRAIDAGRFAVPTVDNAGNLAMGDARAELQAINDELTAAQAIASCNVPRAA